MNENDPYVYYLVRVKPNFCGLDDAEVIAKLDIDEEFFIFNSYESDEVKKFSRSIHLSR